MCWPSSGLLGDRPDDGSGPHGNCHMAGIDHSGQAKTGDKRAYFFVRFI
jgi:hypothetical protein